MPPSRLYTALDPYQLPRGSTGVTHAWMGSTTGVKTGRAYAINDADWESEIMPQYYESVFNKNEAAHLNEAGCNALRIDLDVLCPEGQMTHVHTNEDVDRIFSLWCTWICRLMDPQDEFIVGYALQKETPVKPSAKKTGSGGRAAAASGNASPAAGGSSGSGGAWKDGLRFLIPGKGAGKHVQVYIRNAMLRDMPEAFPGATCVEHDWEKIFDKGVYSAGLWTLYGSSKPDSKPYRAFRELVWNTRASELVERNDIGPAWHTFENVHRMTAKTDNLLPLTDQGETVFDTSGSTGGTFGGRMPGGGGSDDDEGGVHGGRTDTTVAREFIAGLVRMLNPKRAESYESWQRMAQLLKNIGFGTDMYLDLFLEFSSACTDKFNAAEARKKWHAQYYNNSSNAGRRLGLGTLRMWAREDNPAAYEELTAKHVMDLEEAAIMSGAENDVARLLHHMFDSKYVWSHVSKTWYAFRKHFWVDISAEPLEISSHLSTILVNRIRARQIVLETEMKDDSKEEAQKEAIAKYKAAVNLTRKLKSHVFKTNVMKESREFFVDEQFLEKVDANPNLFACENGVLDIRTGEFRDGRPEDYLSKHTRVAYDPSKRASEVAGFAEMWDCLCKIMPVEPTRDFILDYVASALSGWSGLQYALMNLGSGRNGKSMFWEHILQAVFGEYWVLIDVGTLTQKRANPQGPSEHLVPMIGARVIVFKEPDAGVKLNTGMMKTLTPGETITVRRNHKAQEKHKIKGIIGFMCNKPPPLDSVDGGSVRRFLAAEYPTRFCEVPHPENPHEQQIIVGLEKRATEWAPALLAFLIERLRTRFPGGDFSGLHVPEEVRSYTNKFLEMTNGVRKFVRDCFRAHDPDVDGAEAVVPIKKSDISAALSLWKKDHPEYGESVTIDIVMAEITEQFGTPAKHGKSVAWTNIVSLS